MADTVLVTGGSGFLGGWCIVELLRGGHRVRATLRTPSRTDEVRAMIAPHVDGQPQLDFATADLTRDDGWAAAAAGCRHVLHVASPFPSTQPKDPDELIVPARDGALRVLRAALDAGAERIVMTSSVAAVRNGPHGTGPLTEDDWTDETNESLTPYTRSKTIAERAAWALVDERGERERLATVCPAAIMGPLLSDDRSTSHAGISRLLDGMPGVPRLGFNWVDARDVASLHVLAMSTPAAGGQRFVAPGEFLWMKEVADILRRELGDEAPKVPTRTVPDFLVRIMSRFDPEVRAFVGDLGKKTIFSDARARSIGWTPRPVDEVLVDTARSLLAHPA